MELLCALPPLMAATRAPPTAPPKPRMAAPVTYHTTTMFSAPVVASRRAREAEEVQVAAARPLVSAPASPRAPSSPPESIFRPNSDTRTAPESVQGELAPAPLFAPKPPPPLRQAAAPAGPSARLPASGLRAASLGPETSMTEGPLLEELLPLLAPAEGGGGSRRSVAGCALSLTAQSFLGAALLALPRAFLLLGAVPATATLLALAALAHLSCRCLWRAGRASGQASFGGVLAAELGPWAALGLDAAVAFNCFGMLVVCLVALGDALDPGADLPAGTPAWMARLAGSRAAVLGLLSLLVLAPLLSFRRLRHTRTAGNLGAAAVSVWAGVALYLAAVLALREEAHGLRPWPAPGLLPAAGQPWQRTATRAVGVAAVVLPAFLCQTTLLPALQEMEPPRSASRTARATGAAIIAGLCLMLVLAAASQAVFGPGLCSDVLSNFGVSQIRELLHEKHAGMAAPLALSVRGAYLLAVLAAACLQVQQLRGSLAGLRRPRQSYWRVQAAQGLEGLRFWAATCAALAGAYAIAIQVPSIWGPLQLLGATSGAAISFLLPGTLALSMADWQAPFGSGSRGSISAGLLLMNLGLLLAAGGVGSMVLDWRGL